MKNNQHGGTSLNEDFGLAIPGNETATLLYNPDSGKARASCQAGFPDKTLKRTKPLLV